MVDLRHEESVFICFLHWLGTFHSHDWEKTKTSQYRNGVLSRMEELELLSRAKDGRQVTYSLTDKGKLHLVK
jgi:predicted MarR family transcription regulator